MKIPLFKNKDEFSVVYRMLQSIQKSIDIFTKDMQDDRNDISELKIRMGKVEDQMNEFLSRYNIQTEKLKNVIKDETALLEEKMDKLVVEQTEQTN